MNKRIKTKKDKWMKILDNMGGRKYKGSHKESKAFEREYRALIRK